jgi:hypothetical protein
VIQLSALPIHRPTTRKSKMDRRRRFLFGLLAGVMFALGWLVGPGWDLLWPRPSVITEEGYWKIRMGMTLTEVETLLAGPTQNYDYRGKEFVQTRDDIDVSKLASSRYLQWSDSRHIVGIQFDADNRVVGKDFGDVRPIPVWRRLLVWLRRWQSVL